MITNLLKDFETNFDKKTLEEMKIKIVGFLNNNEEFKLKSFFIQTFNLIEESYGEIKMKKSLNKKETKSNGTCEKYAKSKLKNMVRNFRCGTGSFRPDFSIKPSSPNLWFLDFCFVRR